MQSLGALLFQRWELTMLCSKRTSWGHAVPMLSLIFIWSYFLVDFLCQEQAKPGLCCSCLVVELEDTGVSVHTLWQLIGKGCLSTLHQNPIEKVSGWLHALFKRIIELLLPYLLFHISRKKKRAIYKRHCLGYL